MTGMTVRALCPPSIYIKFQYYEVGQALLQTLLLISFQSTMVCYHKVRQLISSQGKSFFKAWPNAHDI